MRVYTSIKVGIRKIGESQINPLTSRPPGAVQENLSKCIKIIL